MQAHAHVHVHRSFFFFVLLLASDLCRAQQQSEAGGVLRQLSIAAFGGSGQTSISALATDSRGNIFVAGTTNALDFPVKNAAQSVLADTTILRTSDLGTTWTRVGSPPGVASILVPDPVASQVLFAGTSFGIFKSSDGGQTWRLVYAFQPNSQFGGLQFNGSLVIDPANHLRLAALGNNNSSGALIRSLDGGETWTSGCPVDTCGGQLIADPSGSGALGMVTNYLYVSRNWGLTFNPTRPPASNTLIAAAMVPSRPGWIYAAGAAGTLGNLSLSTDYGATWTTKANPPTIFSGIYGLAVDPDQFNVLVAATTDGLYLSTDSATSWVFQSSFSQEDSGMQATFALVSHQCKAGGGLFAIAALGYYRNQVGFSPDDGITFTTPQLSYVADVVTGPNCVAYAVRQPEQQSTDAFVAKLAPDGSTLWATYLGGSDQDTAVGLAVDAQGNAYVAGNTLSPDFPSTVPRIGVKGSGSVFVTKYSPDGKIAFSAVIGGEAVNNAFGIALDLSGNAHLLGNTNSLSFPVTPGALDSTPEPLNYTGFLMKLSSNATVIYSTFVAAAGAILIGADDQPILTGDGVAPGLPPPLQETSSNYVVKLDSTGSHVVQAAYIQGTASAQSAPSALAADSSGNLVVLGSIYDGGVTFPITPGAYTSPLPPFCDASSGVYVTKLGASDWKPMYSAFLPCLGQSGAAAVDSTGAVILTANAELGFPLHNPLLAAPTCPYSYPNPPTSAAIARLSSDGSTLEFGSYIDTCGAPPIALAGDGSIYVGVVNDNPIRRVPDSVAAVLHVSPTNPQSISLDQIANAFSGDSSAVVGGGLYSLSVSGFEPPAINLRINPSQDLPTQLGGVEVTFDGVPAAILRIGPGQIIVAPPWNLPAQASTDRVPPMRHHLTSQNNFTSIQLSYNGTLSNAAWMPISNQLVGLLERTFPGSSSSIFPDGNVRNQDGVPNDAEHPAAAGSTITVFVTGMGVAHPSLTPGSIATSKTLAAVIPIYSPWAYSGETITPETPPPPPVTVYSVPGFVSALFQVPIQVPTSIQSLGGTDLGNGVQRVAFALGPYTPPFEGPAPSAPSSVIGFYLK
jgi:uncharacterized protein (TIGR03437 family)